MWLLVRFLLGGVVCVAFGGWLPWRAGSLCATLLSTLDIGGVESWRESISHTWCLLGVGVCVPSR